MTPFLARLPAGYSLLADENTGDLSLWYGHEDLLCVWHGVYPQRFVEDAVTVAIGVDERIQQDRERRRTWLHELTALVVGTDRDDFLGRREYPWHPWSGMERGA